MLKRNSLLYVLLVAFIGIASACNDWNNGNGVYDDIHFSGERPSEQWNKNAVICTFYFKNDLDTQRGINWERDNYNNIKPWHVSVDWHRIQGVIFHDGLSEEFVKKYTTENITFQKVDNDKRFDIYSQRFFVILDFLLDHPDLEYAFLTDGSDVVVRSNPFKSIQKDVLYAGSEPKNINETWEWLVNQVSPLKNFDEVVVNNYKVRLGERTILNAGISGGHRDIYVQFLQEIKRVSEASAGDKKNTIDMAAFNEVLYSDQFSNRLRFGKPVHTVYKSWSVNEEGVFFAHK